MEKEELKQQFLKLYEQGKKDSEISRILNVKEGQINRLRNNLNLPPNGRKIVDDKTFLEAFGEGDKTMEELTALTGMSETAVRRRCTKFNLEFKRKTNTTKLNLEEFLEEYNKGIGDTKLSEIFKCSASKIARFRVQHNLPPFYKTKKSENEEIIKKAHSEGKTIKEISEITGLEYKYVAELLKEFGLEYNKEIKQYPEYTKEQVEALVGTTLGDAYLEIKSGNGTGHCIHCLEQKQLIFYKYELLKNVSNEPRIIHKHDVRFKIPDYDCWYWYIKHNPKVAEICNLFYKDGKKEVCPEIIDLISPLSLALWYMDDGSKVKDGGFIYCTNAFSMDSLNLLNNMLNNKFNLQSKIWEKSHELYISRNSSDTFCNIVESYIVDDMKYKLRSS